MEDYQSIETPLNFNYVHGCLALLNRVLNELLIINKPRIPIKLELVNTMMMSYYNEALTYMFISEYCKLLEKKHGNENENFASLEKLNHQVLEEKGTDYISFNDVNSRIVQLRGTTYYNKIRTWRHTKIAHTDKASDPYNLPKFNEQDVRNAVKHVEELSNICNICSYPYNVHFDIHSDDMTDFTINEFGMYNEYYQKNLPQSFKDMH